MKAALVLCIAFLVSGCAVHQYHVYTPGTTAPTKRVVVLPTVVVQEPVYYGVRPYYGYPYDPGYYRFGGSVAGCRGRVCGRFSWW